LEPALTAVDQGVVNEIGGENAEHPILLHALAVQKIVLLCGKRNRYSEILVLSRLIGMPTGAFFQALTTYLVAQLVLAQSSRT
jgi:hypothetical protein